MVDCDNNNQGCSGGSLGYGFNYVIQNPLTLSKSYPYTGKVGNCQYNREGNNPGKISGMIDVPPNSAS